MIYQIDYSAASSGKMVSMTKRRIRWRWGLANKQALEEGRIGVECRGYEHEVTLVWSITSGKRLIIDDGNEVHFSIGRRAEGKFQHSWTGCNNHVFTIIAYASPPMSSRPGFKQFELLIDGMSYDSFPRIFELGTKRSSARSTYSHDSRRVTSYSEHRSDRETYFQPTRDEEMQWAQRVHALESQRSMNAGSGFAVDKDRTIVTRVEQPQVVVEDLLSPTVSVLDMGSPSPPPLLQQPTLNAPSDQFNISPSQPPSYEAVWSSIMDAYDANGHDANKAITTASTPQTSASTLPDMSSLQISTTPSNEFTFKDYDNCNGSSVDSPRDVTHIDDVLKNLVNLDDISNIASKEYTKENYEKEQREKSRTKSLYELKSMQNTTTTSLSQTKEIMKTHQPVVTNPGSLVVYRQSQHHQQQQQPQGYYNYSYNAPAMYSAY